MIAHMSMIKNNTNLILILACKPAPCPCPLSSWQLHPSSYLGIILYYTIPLIPCSQSKMKFCWLHFQNLTKCDHFPLPSLLQALGPRISHWDYCNGSPNNMSPCFQPLAHRKLFPLQQPEDPTKTWIRSCDSCAENRLVVPQWIHPVNSTSSLMTPRHSPIKPPVTSLSHFYNLPSLPHSTSSANSLFLKWSALLLPQSLPVA